MTWDEEWLINVRRLDNSVCFSYLFEAENRPEASSAPGKCDPASEKTRKKSCSIKYVVEKSSCRMYIFI